MDDSYLSILNNWFRNRSSKDILLNNHLYFAGNIPDNLIEYCQKEQDLSFRLINRFTSITFDRPRNSSRNLSPPTFNFGSQPPFRFRAPPPPPPPSGLSMNSPLFQASNAILSRNPPHLPSNRMSRNTRPNRTNLFNNIFNIPNRNNTPTTLQIYDSVLDTTWRELKQNSTQDMCPITQIKFKDNDRVLQLNHCKHVFKKRSLLQWFERSSLCPVCRHDILTNNTSGGLQQNTVIRDVSQNNSENVANRFLDNLARELTGDISGVLLNVDYDIVDVQITPISTRRTRNQSLSPISETRDISNNRHK